ncbi:hypothetical protein, partial [Bartonella henselae]
KSIQRGEKMKKTLQLLSCIALLIVAGCNMFDEQLALDMWAKPGADQLEVKKALLECGMPSPYNDSMNSKDLSMNANAAVNMCLVKAGFYHKLFKVGLRDRCHNYNAEDLPICVPGSVIPKRSVERRLKSAYCQKYKNKPECQP